MAEEKKKGDISKSDIKLPNTRTWIDHSESSIPEKMERPKPWPSPPDSPTERKGSEEEE